MIYLNEEKIRSLLNWEDTFKATEAALKAVSVGKTVPSERLFSQIFDTPKWMITMPGYLDDETYGGWACKILSGNPENGRGPNPVPGVNGTIVLLDETTGALKAVFGGQEITNWRTAAASAVATRYLHTAVGKPQKILAIFGCGEQGRAHAECFYHCFQFEEIRLWNRTIQTATNLAGELNKKLGTTKFKVVEDKERCATGADVVITATEPALVPVVKYAWLKQGIHINAVGVVTSSRTDEIRLELDKETYRNAHVYVDTWEGANEELKTLKELGTDMKAEVGEVISGKMPAPNSEQITVFQSLGMAVEDCAMARMIYDLHCKNTPKNRNKSKM